MKIILIIALILIIVSIVQRIRIKRKIKNGELEIIEVRKLQKQKILWTWLLILGLFPFVVVAIVMICLAYAFSHNNEKPADDIVGMDYSLVFSNNDSINVSVEINDEQKEEGLVRFYITDNEETSEEFVIHSLRTCYLVKGDTLRLYYDDTAADVLPNKIGNIFIDANKLSMTQFDSVRNVDTNLRIITKIPK